MTVGAVVLAVVLGEAPTNTVVATAADLAAATAGLQITQIVEKVERRVEDQWHHDVAVTNVTLASGEIFGGLVIDVTNLVAVVPVMGTTAVVRLTAPYAQGHYTDGMFSAIEIGDLWQALFAQRLQVGRAAYFPSPSKIRFTDGLGTNKYELCTSLQDYLDAAGLETLAELRHACVPTVGDSAIDGSLRVTGTLASEGTLEVTNANIVARKFSVVNGDLTAVGLTVTNGFCTLEEADVATAASSPRFHLKGERGAGGWEELLAGFTYGGPWWSPGGNLKDCLDALRERAVREARDGAVNEAEAAAARVAGEGVHTNLAVRGGTGKVLAWQCANHTLSVLTEETLPEGGRVYFPHYEHTAEAAAGWPLRFSVLVDYAGAVPDLDLGVYGADDGGWAVVSDRSDAYAFAAGVPTLLEYRQIGVSTLAVGRRDLTFAAGAAGE